MSYCRFGWEGSDVYVIAHCDGGFVCYCGGEGSHTDTEEEMIVHLAAHRRKGDFVPQHAIEGLWEDIEGADEPFDITPFFAYMGEYNRILLDCIRAKHNPKKGNCKHKREMVKIWTLIEEIQDGERNQKQEA